MPDPISELRNALAWDLGDAAHVPTDEGSRQLHAGVRILNWEGADAVIARLQHPDCRDALASLATSEPT